MSYISSSVQNDNLLPAEDAGYAITFDDEEYYTQSEIDSNFYTKSTADSKYVHLDGSKAMGANLDMGSNKITSVVDPTANQEVATKNYVDTNKADVSTWHTYTASSNVDAGDNKVVNVNNPSNSKDAVNLQYYNSNLPSVVYKKEDSWGSSMNNPAISISANSSERVGIQITLNNTKPVWVHAFAQIFKDSSTLSDTDVKLSTEKNKADSIPSNTKNYPRDYSNATLPNIPGDSDTLYFDHSEVFDAVDTVDVSLFITNNHTSQQDYQVIIVAEVCELHSLTLL